MDKPSTLGLLSKGGTGFQPVSVLALYSLEEIQFIGTCWKPVPRQRTNLLQLVARRQAAIFRVALDRPACILPTSCGGAEGRSWPSLGQRRIEQAMDISGFLLSTEFLTQIASFLSLILTGIVNVFLTSFFGA